MLFKWKEILTILTKEFYVQIGNFKTKSQNYKKNSHFGWIEYINSSFPNMTRFNILSYGE